MGEREVEGVISKKRGDRRRRRHSVAFGGGVERSPFAYLEDETPNLMLGEPVASTSK